MNWHEYFMRHVYLAASKSKDRSTKIGAVIVLDQHILATGYNGFPIGVDDNVEERHAKPEKYFWAEHAERNAVFSCARVGVSAKGAWMYTQGIPCADCARAVIQAGITAIIVHKQWMIPQEAGTFSARWAESCNRSRQMFKEARVEVVELNLLLGVEGFVDKTSVLM